MAGNVKLGPGGIREIEFFCQIFQILRGGLNSDLRGWDTLMLLKILADKTYISRKTGEELSEAYRFLRNTEHRLQEFKDLQTHLVPSDSLGRLRLALSMGFDGFEAFKQILDQMRTTVHTHFNQLLESDDKVPEVSSTKGRLDSLWQHLSDPEEAEIILDKTGYREPDKVLGILKFLRDAPETRALSPKGRKRVDLLIPRLLEEVGGSPQPDLILNRIVDLIKAVERRTNYIALLLENPLVLSHLIRLADKSPWIITFLAKYPVLLDELLDHRTLYAPPERAELKRDIQTRLARMSADDLEYQIEALCVFKQVNTLRVAAADVTDALPIMRVSDHLTEIAETVLENVMELARNFMVKKHGAPVCFLNDLPCDNGFLIVGYGKVGGIELGYHSDLDLVFLHAGTSEETRGGEPPIDTPYFFSRLGQRIVHLLTAHTRAGMLYDTDMRLRPSGTSGPLVSQIDSFFNYQMNESWVWEKLALVRARPLCGDEYLGKRFEEVRKNILVCKRDEAELREEVGSMRQKIRKERLKPDPVVFDLKEDKGGIVDIEFIVQYLVLLKSHQNHELVTWTDNVRILETLLESRIINDQTAGLLKEAYLTFRTAIHRLNLQEKPAKVSSDQFNGLRSGVVDIWNTFIG
jgi:glutamate-ammonia-ligase adenylyltransferase